MEAAVRILLPHTVGRKLLLQVLVICNYNIA
jgi:hypothetical protein